MSADNWMECPQCIVKAELKRRALVDDAAKAYGKVSADEYEQLRAGATAKPDTRNFEKLTLREDYEIGIHEYSLDIDYRAACSVCGFTHSFTHTEPIKISETL